MDLQNISYSSQALGAFVYFTNINSTNPEIYRKLIEKLNCSRKEIERCVQFLNSYKNKSSVANQQQGCYKTSLELNKGGDENQKSTIDSDTQDRNAQNKTHLQSPINCKIQNFFKHRRSDTAQSKRVLRLNMYSPNKMNQELADLSLYPLSFSKEQKNELSLNNSENENSCLNKINERSHHESSTKYLRCLAKLRYEPMKYDNNHLSVNKLNGNRRKLSQSQSSMAYPKLKYLRMPEFSSKRIIENSMNSNAETNPCDCCKFSDENNKTSSNILLSQQDIKYHSDKVILSQALSLNASVEELKPIKEKNCRTQSNAAFSKPTKRMKLRLDCENQNIQKSKEQKSNSKNRFSKCIMNDKNSIQRKNNSMFYGCKNQVEVLNKCNKKYQYDQRKNSSNIRRMERISNENSNTN